MSWTTKRGGLIASAAVFVVAVAQAQTTNYWVPTTGTNDWNTAANWSLGSVPNGSDAIASFTNAYGEGIGATLSDDVTLKGLYINDADATDNAVTVAGRRITFTGSDAFFTMNHNNWGSQVWISSTVMIQNASTLWVGGIGISSRITGPLEGSGTLNVLRGFAAVDGLNSNFTGEIIVSNITNQGGAELKNNTTGYLQAYWAYGSSNEPTRIYNRGNVMICPNMTDRDNPEPMHLYGIYLDGSIRFGATKNVRYQGVVTLHTNSSIGLQPDGRQIERRDVYLQGAIVDDGGGRSVVFVNNPNTSAATTDHFASLDSRFVYSGEATYGGFTLITSAKAYALPYGEVDCYLQLTNGNDRLPTTTVVYLGGDTNIIGQVMGVKGAGGVLELSGANQELAGLYLTSGGTGINNRVIGGVSTNSTLTLNIAAGRTNLYGGYLGGAGVNENNLALTKKGNGYLHLTNANTATGPTTIEAGTLRISGSHAGATTVKSGGTLAVDGTHTLGLITIENGGTLGGIGQVGAITSTGTVAPGNSVGTLTANGNVTLGVGATLQIEINEFLGDDYDKLVISGGTLSLSGSPDLAITLNYLPGMGDAFTIVSGMTGFDPGFDGIFSGKPDLGTFDVSGTTFQIDYSETDITLTVVPEPHTLGLLGLAALGGLLRRRIRR